MSRYLLTLLSVAALTLLSAVIVSLVVDPYRIIHPLVGSFSFEPNARVGKIEFLARHCREYRSYFMGDSRTATLSSRDLPGTDSQTFYNLGTQADDIFSINRRVRFLLGRGCPLATVVVDESVDLLAGVVTRDTLLIGESPMISGESRLAFYGKYFLSFQSLAAYSRSRLRGAALQFVYHPDGHADYLREMQDGTSFALPRCGGPVPHFPRRAELVRKLPGYLELSELSRRYHFRVVVWVAPLNHLASALLDDSVIRDYLGQLRSIPNLPVIESDRNSALLGDFHNWYDCGHFRPVIFDRLIAPAVRELLAQDSRQPAPAALPTDRSSSGS